MPRFPKDIRNCCPAGMAGDRFNDGPGPCPWHEGGECVSKHRHGGGAKSGRQAGGSPEERERRARAFLENGRFRNAIEEFKALLSRDPREEWKEGLARSYAGHAEALAEKGMVEEALVVWQNRSRICGKPLMEGPWFEWVRASKSGEGDIVDWVLRTGLFSEKDPETAKNIAWSLFLLPDALFARLGLCRDPLVEVCRQAREAFRHYGLGERESAEELSGRIPSRSPFAPVRFLLRALLLLDKAPDESAGILARLPSTPLDPVVEAAKIALLPLRQRFRALEAARDVSVRRLALELMGFSEKGVDFVLEILRPEARLPWELFQAFMRHRDLFSREVRAAILGRLLLQRGRAGAEEIPRVLSDRPEWERKKALAQILELSNDLSGAESAWKEAATFLHKAEGVLAGKEVGAIYRHIALGMMGRKKEHTASLLTPAQISYLKKSREFDPMHRETLVLLTKWALEKSLKDIDPLLREGMKYYPDDPELLRLRLRHYIQAQKGGECDRIARRLMAVDPQTPESRFMAGGGWNVFFRESVIKRSLPKAKEAHLRIKAMGESSQSGLVRVQALLLAVLEGAPPPEDVLRFLSEKKQGGSLLFRVILDLETLSCRIDRKLVVKTLGKGVFPPFYTASELLDFVPAAATLLAAYGQETMAEAMGVHSSAIAKVDLSGLSPEENRKVIEALLLLGDIKSVKSHLKRALKTHKNHPEFVFLNLKVKAALDGVLSQDDLDRLYDIVDVAEAKGNHDLSKRVDGWLDRYFENEDDDDEFLEGDDGAEEIFGGDPFASSRGESEAADLDRLIDRIVDSLRRTNKVGGADSILPPPPPEVIESIREQYPILRTLLLNGDDDVVIELMKRVLPPEMFKEMARDLGREAMGAMGLGLMKWILEEGDLWKKKRR